MTYCKRLLSYNLLWMRFVKGEGKTYKSGRILHSFTNNTNSYIIKKLKFEIVMICYVCSLQERTMKLIFRPTFEEKAFNSPSKD